MMRMVQRPVRLSIAAVSIAVASCDAPPPEPSASPPPVRRRAEPQSPSAAAPDPAARPTTPSPMQTRRTIGKTTQTVLDLADALAKGGVKVDGAAAAEGGALGTYAQAYRTSMGVIGGLQVEQKMKLHQAEHGTLPETHEEFMATIIAPGTPDELRLPMLPYYQEYAFDPESRGLVVVEFPATKEQRERETTGPSGL